ncbi:AraC family transcriptional regulator [Paenibacillus sp.]|uniref:helix-turn-helix transcriptional regulator n=1 Tax=Paenibacillus sp. TaxID=58172 RepID=UPI002811F413|nr:AraC family transcriptional regulator [Paenibacillus sp.]
MQEYAREFAEFRMQVPSELQRAGGVYLLRSGRNRAKPEYDVGPKMIECFSFHFVVSGCLLLTDERGRKFVVGEGRMFCLFPNVSYRYKIADASTELRMQWFAFGGPQSPHLCAALGLTPDRPSLDVDLGPRWRELANRLHASVGGGDPIRQLRSFYELIEWLRVGTPQEDRLARPRDWLAHCASYIRLHYAEPIRVEALAEEAGVHRSYLSDAFRKAYGMSPKQYATNLRLTNAADLLRDSELPVQDIAATVGYPDLFAFTRAFTKHYRMSPTAYRLGGTSAGSSVPVTP